MLTTPHPWVLALLQAQDHAIDTLKGKADLFVSVIDAAGAKDELSSPNARVTLLAPSDEVGCYCYQHTATGQQQGSCMQRLGVPWLVTGERTPAR